MKNPALKKIHKILRYIVSPKKYHHNIEECDEHCGWWSSFMVDRLGVNAKKGELAIMSASSLPELLWINRSLYKVFYTLENTHAKWSIWRRWENCWTWKNAPSMSIGFDYVNHPKYFRFPYWILTNFSPTATREDITSFIKMYNYSDSSLREKSCAFVCRYDYYGDRAEMADLVESVLPLSYPSDFRHNDDDLRGKYQNDKIAYLRQFRFNFCPENTNNRGYVTEKIIEAIKAGCIPIYWGNEGYPEPDILNPKAIVYIDKEHPQNGLELLRKLNDEPKALLEFTSRPRFLFGADDVIYSYFQKADTMLREMFSSNEHIV